MKGVIFDIQRMSLNDGPGIRTTVFLKGCPLDCAWCHNPESKLHDKQLFFYENKCIYCGKCTKICGNHKILNLVHSIDFNSCSSCGKCCNCCDALEICGMDIDSDMVIDEILKDLVFYNNSAGGVTISGGEPLAQIEFTLDILKKAKTKHIHTCVETSGFSSFDNILKILPYVDLFLWDIKETDSHRHKEYTGVDNNVIMNNLKMLEKYKVDVILRCPIIPLYNDRLEHFKNIGLLAEKLKNVKGIDILPYHQFGKDKARSIGKSYSVISYVPGDSLVDEWVKEISRYTRKLVKIG